MLKYFKQEISDFKKWAVIQLNDFKKQFLIFSDSGL